MPSSSDIGVRLAAADDLDRVRLLFREYHQGVDAPQCFRAFEEELAALPGAYAMPQGAIFLAGDGDGCVAVRLLRPEIAELKRLYVRPAARSLGLGAALVERAIRFAQQAGYQALRLDTLSTMEAAIRLYRRLGFEEIARYNETPGDGTRFFELRFG